LKTSWKDDIFTQKKLELQQNADGTVTPVDKTVYTQTGDSFGAKELNEIGTEVNALTQEVAETKKSVSDGKTLLAAAITAKRVAAAATDTFAQLAARIGQIILGSGNATAVDVLAGKTFTNNTGIEQTGTMANRGAVAQALAINGTYTIPAGYHNGSGKVTQSITTKGAATYTPGTAAQVIAAGQYLSGAQTISAVANLSAANIKKGVVVGGVTGTWEGYVVGLTDIYNYGAQYYGIEVRNGTKRSNSIIINNGSASICYVYTTSQINLTAYSGLTVEISNEYSGAARGSVNVYYGTSVTSVGTRLGGVGSTGSYDTTISLGGSGGTAKVTIQIPFTVSHALTSTIGFNVGIYTGGNTILYRAYLY